MIKRERLKFMATGLKSDPEDYIACFRRNIDMYIADKDITLNDVAEAADMSVSTLKTFLYGNAKDCHLSTAVKLARVFEVSLDEIVGCGTVSDETRESYQMLRQMPESFTHFARWGIRFHYNRLKEQPDIKHAVEVMKLELKEDGSLKTSNQFEVIDIDNVTREKRAKIFMGIKMPSDIYAPFYMNTDTILLANDRKPLEDEKVVVTADSSLWILKAKYEYVDGVKTLNYYSIIDDKLRTTDEKIKPILGYIVEVLH